MSRKIFKQAFIESIPVLTGYIALGMGFGILFEAAGYNYLWALFISLMLFSGSMQYLAVDLLAGAASPITAAISTLLVNGRHLFYGISLIEKYKGAGLKKLYMMFGLTDETYSLVCSAKLPEGANAHLYYFTITLLNQVYWVTGCVLGALVGSVITFDITGIDFVLTALFVTIVLDQWQGAKEHRPALIGIGVGATCLLLFGADNFLIPAMLIIVFILLLLRRKIEHE